jgi:replicative DNA helicase
MLSDELAERMVIGWLQLRPEEAELVAERLAEDDFSVPAHAAMFGALVASIRRRGELDLVDLRDALVERNVLNAVGGMQAVTNCQDALDGCGFPLTPVSAASAVRTVAELARRRAVVAACDAAKRLAMDLARPVDEAVDLARAAVSQAGEARVVAGASLDSAVTELLLEDGGLEVGVEWCVPGLRRFGRLAPGNLVVLAARPKKGKSALALQQALYVAGDCGRPVVFVSCEMTKREVAARALAILGEVDGQATLRRRLFTEDEYARVIGATRRIERMRLEVLDKAGASLADVRALARRVKAREGDLGLIVLDYLQLMTAPERRKGGTREEEVSQLSRGAKALAGELGCPVLALSQLNRAADGQRPRLSHLRESGAIEQDANAVIFIHSDDATDEAPVSDAEVIVAAQRSGPTGFERVVFHRLYTKFTGESAPGGDAE